MADGMLVSAICHHLPPSSMDVHALKDGENGPSDC